MLKLRTIQDTISETNRENIRQVQDIIRTQLPNENETNIEVISDYLQNPMKYRFRAILYIAEDVKGIIQGFTLLLHFSDLSFCVLDYLLTKDGNKSEGLMEALYSRAKGDAIALKTFGIFIESGPDRAAQCSDSNALELNIEKMLFYEFMGARPIINTKYETPIVPSEDNAPFLLFDGLKNKEPLPQKVAKKIVRALLERKYGNIADEEYIDTVVNSFKDNPVKIRPGQYIFKDDYTHTPQVVTEKQKIALIINEKHVIHSIKKKSYLEAPQRISSILKEMESLGFVKKVETQHFAEKRIKDVHDSDFVDYLKRVSLQTEPEKSIFSYIFPVRHKDRIPALTEATAGYYCLDIFTPINKHAYIAAKGSVDCALTGANYIDENNSLAYALVRPPGHHAERKHFGGFCYFNSAAIAAHYLSQNGKVAMLDLDFHHGNGQQNIFYDRNDVLTVSIHRDPKHDYPFFAGFEDEKGEKKGKGYNINYPLGEKINGKEYYKVLIQALEEIKKFSPKYLIVPFGLDTSKGDPSASWLLTAKDFEKNGLAIGKLKIPTLCVQEGGYNTRILGRNAKYFFTGLWDGKYKKGK